MCFHNSVIASGKSASVKLAKCIAASGIRKNGQARRARRCDFNHQGT